MSIRQTELVWSQDGLSQRERLMLLALADHADEDGGSIFPSVARLAWKTGYSERSVQRILRDLEGRGLLAVEGDKKGGRHRTTRYRLTLDNGPMKAPFPSAKGDTTTSPFDPDEVTDDDNERVTGAVGKGDTTGQKGDTTGQKGDTALSPEPSVRTVSKNRHGNRHSSDAGASAKPKRVPIPDSFPLTDVMRAEAIRLGVDPEYVDDAHETFIWYMQEKGATVPDPDEAWRSFMSREREFWPPQERPLVRAFDAPPPGSAPSPSPSALGILDDTLSALRSRPAEPLGVQDRSSPKTPMSRPAAPVPPPIPAPQPEPDRGAMPDNLPDPEPGTVAYEWMKRCHPKRYGDHSAIQATTVTL
ncbi:MAG: helix-turn-helix domain-containing protein [Chloroflexota bacterium]|nr:helix-turn-helix domain-containing protein [Chloroflexota bacterium]